MRCASGCLLPRVQAVTFGQRLRNLDKGCVTAARGGITLHRIPKTAQQYSGGRVEGLGSEAGAGRHGLGRGGLRTGPHHPEDRTRERIEQERDLATQKARLAEAQAAWAETQSARSAHLAETKRNLHERATQADLKRSTGAQEQAKVDQRERLTLLKAPVTGTVQQLAVHTAGGIVTEAQPLLVVVPDEAEVTADVMIENKDVGFVYAGQQAAVKLETFPYTRYGTVAATVKRVTADAVNDEKRGALFPAVLSLGAQSIDVNGERVKLSPGMNVTTEVKTGRRRVIEYLLNPVIRSGTQSLRER